MKLNLENNKQEEEKLNILIIDDDDDIRAIIKLYLKGFSFNTHLFANGLDALSHVNSSEESFDMVLVDYMMPEMNGIEFTRALKNDPRYQSIPIVMLTAKSDADSITEGISAGVLHYISKPIDKKLLQSVISNVTDQIKQQKEIGQAMQIFDSGFETLDAADFEFKYFEETEGMGHFLSKFFPEPHRVLSGVQNLLINALEHGNLKVQHKKKSKDFNFQEWRKEILEKQNLPDNKNKSIRVSFRKGDEDITLTIEDDGDGFEWKRYLDLDPSNALKNFGRGIAMANKINFDKVEYNEKGNKVKITVFNVDPDSYWD